MKRPPFTIEWLSLAEMMVNFNFASKGQTAGNDNESKNSNHSHNQNQNQNHNDKN